jgi:hypothetical protein
MPDGKHGQHEIPVLQIWKHLTRILSELARIAEQGYTMLYGKCQLELMEAIQDGLLGW